MTPSPDGPAWDGARNLADLGGLSLAGGATTRHGRVYRSAAPEWMTAQGWEQARHAGLTDVVDLRNEMERGRGEQHPPVPEAALADITVTHAPTEDPDDPTFLTTCGPWLDHPRSWVPNLELFPDRIARALTAIAEARGAVLAHCAGGRDRTGMIGSMLLVLAGATPEAIVRGYDAGFRGAAAHRGHGWSFHPGSGDSGEWLPTPDADWSDEELDVALAERRVDLLAFATGYDVRGYLRRAGVDERHLRRLERLLVA